MYYRTRTYIAADWDHDKDAVEALHYWNENSKYGLSFSDAHELMQARDSSLNCTIKRSLAERLDASKTFILIVGDHTKEVRAGACCYCDNYGFLGYCTKGYNTDNRSYIEYECNKAVKDGLNIIVLYKSTYVDLEKCPECVRYVGVHMPMVKIQGGRYVWDYASVLTAFYRANKN